MGTWGTGLYSSDEAQDIKDLCQEIYSYYPEDRCWEIICGEFKDYIESKEYDNDTASFWYALADWHWKHGILKDEIKEKVTGMLESRAGIEEWEEEGNKSDIRKRIAVMDKLLAKLRTPQPPKKLPKARIVKPQHKPGDIIIFKSGSGKITWKSNGSSVLQFCSGFKENIYEYNGYDYKNPVNAQNKYMAILCVGTLKEPVSRNVPDVYWEYSVYAYYDYISDKKPDIEELGKVGFLPMVYFAYLGLDKVNTLVWAYRFRGLEGYFSFNERYDDITEKYKVHSDKETERFNRLIAGKEYLNVARGETTLWNVFRRFIDVKTVFEENGIPLDTLIDENVCNPKLFTGEEYAKKKAEYRKARHLNYELRNKRKNNTASE